MGIGFGMTEATGARSRSNRKAAATRTGMTTSSQLLSTSRQRSSLIPIDMPDDEANSTGAKGLGEPVTIPTAAAIANAVYNATGVRVTDTPINPVQLSRLLAEATKRG